MSWTRFQHLLETRPLDRETKLMLIDLLSMSDDPKLEEDLFKLVFAWEESEAATEHELTEGIKKIMAEYTEQEAHAEKQKHKASLTLADDLQRTSRIQQLRDYLQTL
ncbi:hypothetical protein HZA87_04455 [Candidatus Uhrbacteria bacterium]|nr:hypothetical protein [Candidatus Uhrbacteria bacterium]